MRSIESTSKHLRDTLLRSLWMDRSGVALPMMAILFAVLIAFMGMVLDGGRIYFEKRRIQAAADAGAYGGAHEIRRLSDTEVVPAARYDARLNGYEHGAGTVNVEVNRPPSTGPNSTFNSHVEVIVSEVVPTYFMRVLNWNQATIRARAVAGVEYNNDMCVLALDPNAQSGLRTTGTSNLNANCGIMVNSGHLTSALDVNGTGNLRGTWVGVYGGYDQSGGGSALPTPVEDAAPMWDPLSTRQPPGAEYYTPEWNIANINSDVTLFPGYYRQTLRINGGVVTFQPGIYILSNGLRATGGTLTGTEVGFYSVDGLITITASANIDLSAPTSGPMQGILFWSAGAQQEPGNLIRGTASSRVAGAIYTPLQHTDFAGDADTVGEWTLLIANTIDLSGTSAVSQFRGPPPGTIPELTTVTLVE